MVTYINTYVYIYIQYFCKYSNIYIYIHITIVHMYYYGKYVKINTSMSFFAILYKEVLDVSPRIWCQSSQWSSPQSSRICVLPPRKNGLPRNHLQICHTKTPTCFGGGRRRIRSQKHQVTNNGPLDLVFVQVAPLPRPLCCGLCHGAVTGAITTPML